MSAASKILAKMRRTKADWGPQHFRTLYLAFGFEEEEGGNHTVYIHPKYPELRATVARHSPLATGYAQTALKLIDKLKELEGEADDNGEDDQSDD
ncbi:MAG TPA: hypothetical protein VKU00_14950 [Chthonomonadaceae bacterium]|nr:hypothetical protein [Chthonomonadaceae bacterium]